MNPTTPQKEAGCLMEPPVSLPSEAIADPTETTAAEPPEEPPGTQSGFHGFYVGPKAEFSVDEPIANSSKFVFPVKITPHFLNLSITVAS